MRPEEAQLTDEEGFDLSVPAPRARAGIPMSVDWFCQDRIEQRACEVYGLVEGQRCSGRIGGDLRIALTPDAFIGHGECFGGDESAMRRVGDDRGAQR